MNGLAYILAIFGTYRLAYDISRMDGPFNAYTRLRGWAIGRWGDGHWVADGLNCPVCVSFWVALPFAVVALWLDPTVPIPLWPFAWLGVAGGALMAIKATT